MTAPYITQHHIKGIGNGAVQLTINEADNEVLVVLNGTQIALLQLHTGNQNYSENIAQNLKPGEPNVLCITLANYMGAHGNSPAVIQGVLAVQGHEYSIGYSNQSASQGVKAQITFLLEK